MDAIEKAREAAARALCIADGKNPDIPVAINPPEYEGGPSSDVAYEPWTLYLKQTNAAIDAFLSSLKEDGLVIVPVEATEEVVADIRKDWGGLLNEAQVGVLYAAMIAAADPTPEQSQRTRE